VSATLPNILLQMCAVTRGHMLLDKFQSKIRVRTLRLGMIG